ncbi:hypothetical protein [Acaryochloris marina]|uniref:hypothetical protein n=1 Tax=Acaryochloris marina TaxID=155978 RepID=UPI001BAE9243|nr:hypothetical protein [Acaryochloris marina]QUY44094.1 hypothetical protein I1H34_08395 [Acaryochloris marina S15]
MLISLNSLGLDKAIFGRILTQLVISCGAAPLPITQSTLTAYFNTFVKAYFLEMPKRREL